MSPLTLTPGARLGPYEIAAQIGVGGMGEVYRATDTKLKRQVAIKVLPASVAGDPDRLARFQREAEVLAALNHPNIAAIYGLEEGPTLADRIAQGAIPLDGALPIAKQIAEALEAAHERGIIHRDLKPANIKGRSDGTVKVLDFGLAKAMEPVGTMSPSASMSPTISLHATMAGVILGTAAYMSPEQARGGAVDRRADIWAFGVVLYEMLTGTRAFEGDTISDTLASVLKTDPRWTALPPDTPAPIRRLLQRCLEKDRKHRVDSAVAVRLDIQEALANPTPRANAGEGRARGRRPSVFLVMAVTTGLAAAAALAWALKPVPTSPTRNPAHVDLTLPPGERLDVDDLNVALSTDGAQIAYVATRDGVSQLYVRPLAVAEARAIPGTEGAFNPFFSPDGQWIGFFAQGKMKKVPVRGGAPQILGDAEISGGAAWGENGTIIFAPSSQAGSAGLWSVSAAGGRPKVLTTPDLANAEYSHRYPQIVPGGKAVVFTALNGFGWDESRIELLRLDTHERRVLVRGGHTGRVLPSGHLVYYRSGALLALPFDLSTLQVRENVPTTVADGILQNGGAVGAAYAVSPSGLLAYVPAAAGAHQFERRLVWVDRQGTITPLKAPTRAYGRPALSVDSQHVAVSVTSGTEDLWTYDISTGSLSRLPSQHGSSIGPVWTPDGRRVAYRSNQGGHWNVYWQAVDGTGGERPLDRSQYNQYPSAWSPDGKVLALERTSPTTGNDIWMLSVEGSSGPQPFLQTPSSEGSPTFSPDDHWLAYDSNESGAWEVYVQAYPGPGRRWQISSDGGSDPQWNPSGRELFYRNGNKTMVADVVTSPTTFSVSRPRVLYDGPEGEVSRDGQRFLALQSVEPEQPPTQIRLILNWTEELKRLVPAK